MLAPSDELLPKLAACLAGSPPTPPATSAAALPAAADDTELAGCASSAQAPQLLSSAKPEAAAIVGKELLQRDAAGCCSAARNAAEARFSESGQPGCQTADVQRRAAAGDAHAAQPSNSAAQQQRSNPSATDFCASRIDGSARPADSVSAPAMCCHTAPPDLPCAAEPHQPLEAEGDGAALESEEGFQSPKTGKVIPIGG